MPTAGGDKIGLKRINSTVFVGLEDVHVVYPPTFKKTIRKFAPILTTPDSSVQEEIPILKKEKNCMKTIKIIGAALVAVVLGVSLCACSDDEDDNNNASSSLTSGTIIKTTDGNQLLLAGINYSSGEKYSFRYDDQGRCNFLEGAFNFEMSYDPYKIVIFAYDELQRSDLTFNTLGYVTKINCARTRTDLDYERYDSAAINISYDGDYPTTIIENYSAKEIDNKNTLTQSLNATSTLTWKDGNLTKMDVTWEEYDDESGSWPGACTFTYEYGEEDNEYKQHTLALNEAFYFDFMEDLGFIGYFGKGTSLLPTSCEVVWDEYDNKETYSFTASYTKNRDGTIETEKINSNTYTYSYTSLGSVTRSRVATPLIKTTGRKSMFGIHHSMREILE